jgi:hypothetical protein
MLFFTKRPERLLARWRQAASRELDDETSERLRLNEVTEAVIGETVTAMLIFSGCRAADDDTCRLRGDYEIYGPEGVRLARFADVDIWDRKPAPHPRSFQLSKGAAAIATAGGRPGSYRVLARVRDLNGNAELELWRDVELRTARAQPPRPLRRWHGRPASF